MAAEIWEHRQEESPDLHDLHEAFLRRAQGLETGGSFYAGTLEREWVYNQLSTMGFFISEIKDRIEAEREDFRDGRGSFFFEQALKKCEKKYVDALFHALRLAEAGILSEQELAEFGEPLRSGEEGVAFLSQKQRVAEDLLLEAFPEFASYPPSEREVFIPLHNAFQFLLEHGMVGREDEERYVCARLGRPLFRRGRRIGIPTLADFMRWDSILSSLNIIRRGRALGILSGAQADRLVAQIHR